MNGQATLFAYGTLRDPEVQLAVFGRTVPSEADALTGYALTDIDIDGTTYRGLVPGTAGDRVLGLVLDVTMAEMYRADDYEGATHYVRKVVRLDSGRCAGVYVSRTVADDIGVGSAHEASVMRANEVLLFVYTNLDGLIDWEGQSVFGSTVDIDKDALLGFRAESMLIGRTPYKYRRPESDALHHGTYESYLQTLRSTGDTADRVTGHAVHIDDGLLRLADAHVAQWVHADLERVTIRLESGRDAFTYKLPEGWALAEPRVP